MSPSFSPISNPLPPPVLIDPGYGALKQAVIEATGLAYYLDKDDDLGDRLARRMQAVGSPDCLTYLALLHDAVRGDAELDRLVEQLTVGETSFFRHREIFDGLRQTIMPDLMARNGRHKRLRVWCAGCSVGAEVYTLSILFTRELADMLEGWDISILGTDINRAFLARAREGVFNSWHLRDIDPATLHECFTRRGDDWLIRPEYRQGVSFQYHNLVRNPFPSLLNGLTAMDVIFCRNVLIYFSQDVIRKIVGQFRGTLADGGWLVVGHAEPNVNMFREFRTVNVPGAVLYQKIDSPAPISAHSAPAPALVTPTVIASTPPMPRGAAEPAARSNASAPEIGTRRGLPWLNQQPAEPAYDLAEIERLANAGDLEQAACRCEHLTVDQPTNPVPHLRLAMLAEQLGRHRQAEASLRRTLAITPDNALALYFWGLLEQKSGRRAGAISAYARVLATLAAQPDDQALLGLDGLTAGELREMARMQQEVLGA